MSDHRGRENGSGHPDSWIDSGPVRQDSPPLESLFTYPSLQRLFEGSNRNALADLRARLERTHRTLERVIRQGPPRDSARAARVAEAYNLALDLLTELEHTSHK